MYWNRELTVSKNDSIVAHDFWKMSNCPRSGPIFEAKKHSFYKYKLCIRSNKTNLDQEKVDSLNEDLLRGDHCKFWKSFKYYNYNKVSQSSRINGLTDDPQIANCFAANFSRIYESTDKSQSAKLNEQFLVMYNEYHVKHANDSINSLYLSLRQPGKATASFLKPEHILYGSPKLACHIHLLFNAMIQHCYVPHFAFNQRLSG